MWTARAWHRLTVPSYQVADGLYNHVTGDGSLVVHGVGWPTRWGSSALMLRKPFAQKELEPVKFLFFHKEHMSLWKVGCRFAHWHLSMLFDDVRPQTGLFSGAFLHDHLDVGWYIVSSNPEAWLASATEFPLSTSLLSVSFEWLWRSHMEKDIFYFV